MPWRSRWSGVTLRSTATSGAKASESSSWKEEHSQTIVADGSISPGSEASGVPTLPATVASIPASRSVWPSHSATVVLPLVPVTAAKRLSSSRQPSSSSPITSRPRSRAAATTGASAGTPGLLTTVFTSSSSWIPSPSSSSSTPSSASLPAPGGFPESVPYTRAPSATSAFAAATPERARPTTRYGPGGRGGRLGPLGSLVDITASLLRRARRGPCAGLLEAVRRWSPCPCRRSRRRQLGDAPRGPRPRRPAVRESAQVRSTFFTHASGSVTPGGPRSLGWGTHSQSHLWRTSDCECVAWLRSSGGSLGR